MHPRSSLTFQKCNLSTGCSPYPFFDRLQLCDLKRSLKDGSRTNSAVTRITNDEKTRIQNMDIIAEVLLRINQCHCKFNAKVFPKTSPIMHLDNMVATSFFNCDRCIYLKSLMRDNTAKQSDKTLLMLLSVFFLLF